MQIKILFFASTRESTGLTSTNIEIPDIIKGENEVESPPSVLNVRILLDEMFPDLVCTSEKSKIAIAVNQVYSNDDVLLKDGDVIALIPPISGG
eukprot:gene7058-9634_t